MIPLYTNTEFEISKSRDFLPLRCKHCDKTFHKTKHSIQDFMNPDKQDSGDFCCIACAQQHRIIFVACKYCDKPFNKWTSQIKRSTNNFCSQSCAAKWCNTHKKTGTRRSKLEVWLEEQLKSKYPNLDFDFNKTNAIESELDIFIPSLKLAFELNGIFHYEPIYGQEKLASTRSNDNRKMLACAERGIELCVIDNSSMTNFKPLKAQKFLDIITDIITKRIGGG